MLLVQDFPVDVFEQDWPMPEMQVYPTGTSFSVEASHF
jgi:hypothetical protein